MSLVHVNSLDEASGATSVSQTQSNTERDWSVLRCARGEQIITLKRGYKLEMSLSIFKAGDT